MIKFIERQNKLVLGTAQFGSKYGVTNNNYIGVKEGRKIFDFCYKNNVREIDTAIDYSGSEKILGSLDLKDFKIATKLPKLISQVNNYERWINDEISSSLKKMNLTFFDTLYLHNPRDILGENGLEIYKILKNLKSKQIIKNIGISVYTPKTMLEIINKYQIDIVQFPFNVFDNRFNTELIISELEKKSIKVYLRSIFLQGLLITNSKNHHAYFQKWKPLFIRWETWLYQNNLTAIDVCLNYVLSNFKDAKIILGVSSLEELTEIINSDKNNMPVVPNDIICDDLELIDPRKWVLKI